MNALVFCGPISLTPFVRQHAGKSPIFLLNFLKHDVDMFGFLPKHIHERLRELCNNLPLFIAACAFRDLYIHIRHLVQRPFELLGNVNGPTRYYLVPPFKASVS